MKTYKILIPVFNDWESLLILLNNIHDLKINNLAHIKILIIDDCSSEILNKKIEFDSFEDIEIFNIVKMLNEKEGVSILLAEQNTNIALKNSDYGYIIETGNVMLEGPAKNLLGDDKVKELYLGISKGKRLNFRDAIKDNEKKINSSN